MASELNLSNLKPAQDRRDRKRVGRGMGSGKGRYAGRGIKGQKARSGSHKMRAGFEGGQNPLYMRIAKQRGSTSKDAMPVGPFRTETVPVNLRALEERFDDGADVTLEALVSARLIKNTRKDVKVLGNGDLTKRLTVTAHRFSATARQKIEAAGGKVVELREPAETAKPKRARETGETAAAETTAGAKRTAHEADPAVEADETDREAIAEAVDAADETEGES